jgi:hypothetical protein
MAGHAAGARHTGERAMAAPWPGRPSARGQGGRANSAWHRAAGLGRRAADRRPWRGGGPADPHRPGGRQHDGDTSATPSGPPAHCGATVSTRPRAAGAGQTAVWSRPDSPARPCREPGGAGPPSACSSSGSRGESPAPAGAWERVPAPPDVVLPSRRCTPSVPGSWAPAPGLPWHTRHRPAPRSPYRPQASQARYQHLAARPQTEARASNGPPHCRRERAFSTSSVRAIIEGMTNEGRRVKTAPVVSNVIRRMSRSCVTDT